MDVVADLHRAAGTRGATLHVAGVDRQAVSHPLRAAGVDPLPDIAPSADAVIALLHHAGHRRVAVARATAAADPPTVL